MAATLLIGAEDRDSAKKRRKEEYRQDLELQMREKEAAKKRERLQDMRVNASGWLDPEKRPERLKPLGGVHWTEQRGRRDERVKPYHTLFLYDRQQGDGTYAGAGANPGGSVDQAYNFMGARDLGYGPGGGGSIVQPISLPHSDNRPIIISGGGGSGSGYQTTRTIVEYKDDGTAKELRNLLTLVQSEKDKMRRDNDEFQRKLRQDLENEKRKLNDAENEARRRVEKLRQEAEENRRQASRQRHEAERMKKEAETRPKSARPATGKKTMLYYDMDDYRQRLIDERKKMEELLKAASKPPADNKGKWDVQVVQKPRFRLDLPPTPPSADRANRDNIREFTNLKLRDFERRDEFRHVYSDVPVTNRRLEEQQEALLRHQGISMPRNGFYTERPRKKHKSLDFEHRRAVSHPGWLDRTPTPFPHVLRQWDAKYGAFTTEGITRRRQESPDPSKRRELRLSSYRPYSTETLTDDTWIRPSITARI